MRNSQPALWEKPGVEQALNAGLTLSAPARMSLIEPTGSHLPQGVGLRVLVIPEKSVARLCRGQYWDLEYQGVEQALNAGLALCARARMSLIEHTGSHPPVRCRRAAGQGLSKSRRRPPDAPESGVSG